MSKCRYTVAAGALVVALAGCVGTTEPVREPMTTAPRGDNPNMPNPVTPQAANESAPQPQGSLREPTNSPGIPR